MLLPPARRFGCRQCLAKTDCGRRLGAVKSGKSSPQYARSQRTAKAAAAKRSLVLMAQGSDASILKRVLFVCLGNICRSPAAEAVFRAAVERAGRSDLYFIDSCGTGGGIRDWYKRPDRAYHIGDPADERMMAAAAKRGIQITSRSRPLAPQDLATFDHIVVMDFENIAAVQVAADYWAAKDSSIPPNYRDKMVLMCKYLQQDRFRATKEVPDPYWSGEEGFELVLDLLEDACQGLLKRIESE